MPFVSKKKLNKLIEQLIKSTELVGKQERIIKNLKSECNHLRNYNNFLEGCIKNRIDVDFPNSFLEGCIKNRVDVDFPNSTVRKGGKVDNTGSRFF